MYNFSQWSQHSQSPPERCVQERAKVGVNDPEEPSSGNQDEQAPRPARARRASANLAALYEEVDNQVEQAAGKSRMRPQTGFIDLLASASSATAPTAASQMPATQLPVKPEETDDRRLSVPPELESYLSPELWRRLNSPEPPRGVLINALERLRSVLYQLSTFLPAHLVQEKMRRPYAGMVKGQMLRGSLLFSDVSGFTALSERLAEQGPDGAEQLTTIMNRYFSAMLEILAWSGGILLKFAGDATLVYFPEQEENQQARWALRAAQRMMRAMKDFSSISTPAGAVNLRMKIGVATGEFLAASVGSERRMEYAVLGPAISETMTAEGLTSAGGQIVVNAATAVSLPRDALLKALKGGFYLLSESLPEALDDFEIKVEARRARDAIHWDAAPQAILAQIEVALRQIKALQPYLPAELLERLLAHASRRRVESEYRPATVMFVNFCGPERLLECWGAGAEGRVTGLLNAYFTAMSEVIAHYGGVITRIDPYSKGTKMLVLFGAPVAHEDDPQRAVSAALAMNAEVDAVDENWRQRLARQLPDGWQGPLIQHRIGITYGETFAGQVGSSTRREYTVMGDDVNLAARLMGTAEMGRILISQAVRQLVADYFILTERAAVKVKGKRKPIPIYQVEGPQDDTLANRVHKRGALIGRLEELAQAEAALHRAMQGAGSLLSLVGPAGMGKSHLADTLVQRAEAQGALVLLNLCRSYLAQTPFAVWSLLFRSLAGITSVDYNPQLIYHKYLRLLGQLGLSPASTAPLAALMGLRSLNEATPCQPDTPPVPEAQASTNAQDESLRDLVVRGGVRRRASNLNLIEQLEQTRRSESGQTWQQMPENLTFSQRQELYNVVWQVLARLAQSRPLLIFFEDAHWLDNASLDLLYDCAKRAASERICFLLAQRPMEAVEKQEGWKITVRLEPLRLEETQALVAHLLVSDLAPVIHEQSSGSPLLATEITHWFKRTYKISPDELRAVLQGSDFLQKLVLSGVESLPEAQREVARAAAVIGQEFHTSAVQALLAAEYDPVTLSNHLRALARERLLTLLEAGADARYAFQQSLVRDILYSSLPFERRKELHLRVAEYLSQPLSQRRRLQARIAAVLESSLSNNPAQLAASIAHHREQAHEWLPAAQSRCASAEYYRQHAQYEIAGQEFRTALANLERSPVEGHVSEIAALRARIYAGLGDLAVMSLDHLAAVASYESALAEIPGNENLSGAPTIAELTCKLALVLPLQNRYEEAVRRLAALVEQAATAQDASIAAQMAWLLWRAGNPEAQTWIQRTRTLLEGAQDPWAWGVRVLLTDLAGDWEQAIDGYLLLEKYDGAALAAVRLGDRRLNAADLPGALAYFHQAQALWQDAPLERKGSFLAQYRQSEVHWRQGDKPLAREILQQALQEIDHAAPSLQAHGRVAVQKALRLVEGDQPRTWPDLNFQLYDDELRLSLLFRS